MSSIGRTRITTSQVFALSAGMIMLAGGSLFAQQTIQKITQNGPITVNFEEFAWFKNKDFKLAELDSVELSSAQNRIEIEVQKSQTKITTPRALIPAAKKIKLVAKLSSQARARTEELKIVQPTFDSSLVSLPTEAEIKSMQNVYLAMRGNFEVATQSRPILNTQPAAIATRDLDEVPTDLSADEEEFLAAYESAPVMVDDVIEPPPAPPAKEEKVQVAAVVADTQLEKSKSDIQLDPTPEVAVKPGAIVSQSIIHDLAAPTLTLDASAIQTTEIDEVPPLPTEVVNEKPITIQQSAALREPPAAVVAPETSEDLRAYTEDLVTVLDTQPDPVSEYPKSAATTRNVDSQEARKPPSITVNGQRVADRSTSQTRSNTRSNKRVEAIAMAEASALEVKGVKSDPNGVSISWNENESLEAAESLIDSDIGSSFQIGKFEKKSGITTAPVEASPAEKPLLDPKRFCDSALIGKEALLISPNQETMSVCRRSISYEGARGNQSRWWEVRESTSHWPTLTWQKEADAFLDQSRIPMLSFNTVKLLSAISRAEAQLSAGIVFGEIPAGLEMSLSGRADAPTYFDRNMKPIASSDVTQARYFAFLNVAPGNPLLYVSSRSGTQSAAISILVQAGHGTYVSVPLPKLIKIKTRIYDANSARPRGLSALSVQVIGQEGRTAVTNTQGQFEITDVVTFGDHPIYLDVAPNEQSFKHRYRLSPNEVTNKNLFYFSEQTVAHWVSQLEGGVSPMSGLIVGAVSRLEQEKDATLRIGSLEKKTLLSPEVYALSANDELVADPKLGRGQVRFMGVQISEGANIPSIFNSAGEMIWSELVIAQPGVINVVGP